MILEVFGIRSCFYNIRAINTIPDCTPLIEYTIKQRNCLCNDIINKNIQQIQYFNILILCDTIDKKGGIYE